ATVLPNVEGAQKTEYEVVVVGATLDLLSDPAIFSDARFASFKDAWQEQSDYWNLHTLASDFVLPVLEVIGAGTSPVTLPLLNAGALSSFKSVFDPELLARGIAVPVRGKAAFNQTVRAI